MKATLCNTIARRLGLLLLPFVLAACNPTLNWREMPAADGALRVAFPAKPHTETRQLPVADGRIEFHLTAARAGGAVYAVGHGRLPATLTPAQRDAVRTALEQSLTANLHAEHSERRQAQVRHADGAARPGLAVDELEIRGRAGEEPVWLLAQVFLLGEQVVEVAAIGPQQALPREAARAFLDSLRLQ